MPKDITTIRLTEEDRAIIVELKRRTGLTSNTQIIRLALRLLAERKDDQEQANQPERTHNT